MSHREGWRERAACHGLDPELFYPVGLAGPAHRKIALAKSVCANCPVAQDCLSWAVQAGEPDGVWGGTTPDERRQLRRGPSERARQALLALMWPMSHSPSL